jgi:hypothetical protein
MTPVIAEELARIAAELVGTVHDFGPDVTARVLEKVPADQLPAFAVVLAAMVDPTRSVSDLLAWTKEPVRSREFAPKVSWPTVPHPELRPAVSSSHHRDLIADRRTEVRRLTAAGLSASEIALRLQVAERTVTRHRTAIQQEVA